MYSKIIEWQDKVLLIEKANGDRFSVPISQIEDFAYFVSIDKTQITVTGYIQSVMSLKFCSLLVDGRHSFEDRPNQLTLNL